MEKVIWSEGLFLRPQHFQQQDRYLDFQIRRRHQTHSPFFWGFLRLTLDENLLQVGKIAVVDAEGLLPDGTLFRVGQNSLYELVIDQDLQEGDRVHIAVPALIEGAIDSHEIAEANHRSRFRANFQDVHNGHGDRSQTVQVMTGSLRIRLVTEQQLTDRDVSLPVCRIKEQRPDGSIRLDTEFCPPLLRLDVVPRLLKQGQEVLGLVQTRTKVLSERLSGQMAGTVSSVADLLLLQNLNRHVPLLHQALQLTEQHPFELFHELLALYGDIATLCQESRQAETRYLYDHNNLAASYSQLVAELRLLLSRVFEQSAQSLSIHRRKFGLNVVPLGDLAMLRSCDFVLALKADVTTDQLAKLVPTRVKVGSVGKIRDIVNLQLSGCKLTALPTAPRQLPYHAGFQYFRVENHKEIWSDVEQSGGFAVHVSGEIAGLEMEFWSLKR